GGEGRGRPRDSAGRYRRVPRGVVVDLTGVVEGRLEADVGDDRAVLDRHGERAARAVRIEVEDRVLVVPLAAAEAGGLRGHFETRGDVAAGRGVRVIGIDEGDGGVLVFPRLDGGVLHVGHAGRAGGEGWICTHVRDQDRPVRVVVVGVD